MIKHYLGVLIVGEFNTETKVEKTRKDHVCLGCLNKIPKGSTAFNNSGYFEDFYNYYLCLECKEFLIKYNRHEIIEEGLFDGCVNEIKEYENIGGALIGKE